MDTMAANAMNFSSELIISCIIAVTNQIAGVDRHKYPLLLK